MYTLTDELIEEARNYAALSKRFTSNRHDFHDGSLSQKENKMLSGKLGEGIFKMFLDENEIVYERDKTSHEDADDFDFRFPNSRTLDVKTRTKDFHIRTLEMVEQFNSKPKDIFVSVRLNNDYRTGSILGWFSSSDMLRINRIENLGYLDNYVIFDNELRPIETIIDYIT